MTRVLVRPLRAEKMEVKAAPSMWWSVVLAAAAAATGGGRVCPISPRAYRFIADVLGRLGFNVALDHDCIVVEEGGARSTGEVVVSVGCSYDLAAFVSIVSASLAPPAARIVIRGCEELVEADWRPVLETISVIGGRAWPTGSPKSLLVIEAVGRGRVRGGLWRIPVSRHTVSHITAAVVAALSSKDDVYIRVWPKPPHSRSEITPVTCALSDTGLVESNPDYSKFRVRPGRSPPRTLIVEPDYALALSLSGVARGAELLLRIWGGCRAEYNPRDAYTRMLEQLGFRVEVGEEYIRVSGLEEPLSTRFWLEDYPSFAPAVLSLAPGVSSELVVEGYRGEYAREVDEVAGALAAMGFSIETWENGVRVKPAETQLQLEEVAVTCTTPFILLAALNYSCSTGRRVSVDRGDCLYGVWDEVYQLLEKHS